MSLLPTVGAIDQDTGFYNGAVSNSLRVNAGHTLSNTFGTPTSTTTMSFGGWFKFSAVQYQNFFSQGLGGSGVVQAFMRIDSNFKLNVDSYDGSSMYFNYITSRVFRDTSAWYHIWVQIDTTDGTNSDRVKIYVNGIRQTSFDTATHVSSQSSSVVGWNTAVTHYIGYNNASYGLNGYIADFWFLDGQDVSPVDTVGEFKNGIFIPKEYSATFGNNGFHLKFNGTGTSTSSGSVANPTNIGDDSSGQNNHWSVTSSTVASHDANLPDCPENNFCTMNFLDKGSQVDLSEGNLGISWNNNSGHAVRSTFSVSSGKWYMEFLRGTSSVTVGIAKQNNTGVSASSGWIGSSAYGSGGSYSYSSDANKYTNGSNTSYGASYSSGDVIGVAYDADNGTITFYKDGSSQGQAYSSISGEFAFGIGFFGGSTGGTVAGANFGQDSSFAGAKTSGSENAKDANGIGDFYDTPPSGYLALCSANLDDSTIGPNSGIDEQAANYFDVFKYTGNGSDNHDVPDQSSAITVSNQGLGFKPDMVMTLRNNGGYHKFLTDSTRGGSKNFFMTSNSTHNDDNASIKAFNAPTDSDPATNGGYRLGTSTNFNVSSADYYSPCWKVNGGTTSTISVGDISSGVPSVASTVQVNTTAGISIVQATSPASGTWSVAHGLGVKPKWVILKYIANSSRFTVFFDGFTSGQYLELNGTGGVASSGTPFNFTVTDTIIGGNANYDTTSTVAMYYCFAEIEGFSKIGTFQGNSDPNGPYVHTGFRPQMIIAKSQGTGHWHTVSPVFDHDTGNENVPLNPLGYFNLSDTDGTTGSYQNYAHYDFLSNGFKIRDNGSESNASGLFNYYAVATSPFKYSNAG